MKSDILKQNDIVDRILSDLSKYCDIPNNGFLAGGSVANLLLSYVWGGEYPINDLDIFIESEDSIFDDNGTAPIRNESLIMEGDGYMTTKLIYDHGGNYRIKKVERDGMLNTITISKLVTHKKNNGYGYVLNGFDFNCCQVGIDLSINQIIFTSSFESFLNNKQLEVTAIYTPAHTAIRLFKKLDELNCYCDIEESMNLLSQPLIMDNLIYIDKRYFGIYFSVKYKEMYDKYYNKIKNYFVINRFFDHKKKLYNKKIESDTFLIDESEVNWINSINRSIPEDLLKSWAKYNSNMWTLEPKKYTSTNKKIDQILVGLDFNPLTFMNAYKIISNKKTKKLREKAEKIVFNNFWLCKMAALINEDFYNCDFDINHISYIESFVDKERWVILFIVREGLNIQESYEFISNIKKIINKEGEWVTELIISFLENKNKFIKLTYENLITGVEKEKQKFSKDLIEPLDITKLELPDGVVIKEVTSELNLKWAGKKLNNCMDNPQQNYKEKISSGNTKIFLIITNNNMSGLEIKLVEGTIYKTVQILSYCNKVTSEYHKVISHILLNFINMEHLKFIYESKIKSFISIDLLNRGFLINLKDEKTTNNPTGEFNLGLNNGDIFNLM